jgi:hypothetical protein
LSRKLGKNFPPTAGLARPIMAGHEMTGPKKKKKKAGR